MVRGSARAHCDSGYWPAKEGRTRFLSVCTLLRTPQLARFVGLLFPSPFCLLYEFQTVVVYRVSRRVVSPRRIHDFSPSANQLSVSMRFKYRCFYKTTRRVVLSFLERISVSYIRALRNFPPSVPRMTYFCRY